MSFNTVKRWTARVGATALVGGTVVMLGASGASASGGSWENCGQYTCTTYFSRAETRNIQQDAGRIAALSQAANTVGCTGAFSAGAGVVGAVVGAIAGGPPGAMAGGLGGLQGGGVAGGVICAWMMNGPSGADALEDAANQAVQQNACLQIESNRDGSGDDRVGVTNHPSYCFN